MQEHTWFIVHVCHTLIVFLVPVAGITNQSVFREGRVFADLVLAAGDKIEFAFGKKF